MRFEGEILGEEGELKQLANSMVVFMVQALFYNFNFPYVQFACNTLSGDILMKPLWDAVFRLERMGLAVLTLVLQPIVGCGSYIALTCVMSCNTKSLMFLLLGVFCTSSVIHHNC